MTEVTDNIEVFQSRQASFERRNFQQRTPSFPRRKKAYPFGKVASLWCSNSHTMTESMKRHSKVENYPFNTSIGTRRHGQRRCGNDEHVNFQQDLHERVP
jgi:hypothetical protein